MHDIPPLSWAHGDTNQPDQDKIRDALGQNSGHTRTKFWLDLPERINKITSIKKTKDISFILH